jgi:hypothetical protein
MNKDATLLCTFSTTSDCQKDISKIFDTYEVFKNTIFVLQNKQNSDDIYLTYNLKNTPRTGFLKNTSSMHRKKSVNAIYSINALNEIVKLEGGEKPRTRHTIDWEKYKNSILLYRDNALVIIPTKILTIYRQT